jgi:hypothetical protein
MIDVVAEAGTPMIAMAASARIIEPMDGKRYWVFKTPQNDAQMATAIVEHMTNNNVKTVAYIGFADAYGEGWWNEFSKIAEARKIQIVANERFNRSDTSVTGQVLKTSPPSRMRCSSVAPVRRPPCRRSRSRKKATRDHVPDAWSGQRRLPAGLRQGL